MKNWTITRDDGPTRTHHTLAHTLCIDGLADFAISEIEAQAIEAHEDPVKILQTYYALINDGEALFFWKKMEKLLAES